jgi:hypothetical protein
MAAALTTNELIASLQNEVRILLHLAGKIEPQQLDYRPGPKQRSTIELLRYLVNMGPMLVRAIKAGAFDGAAFGAAAERVNAADLDEVLKLIAAQKDEYAEVLGSFTDDEFRGEIEMFGNRKSRASFIADLVLCGCAAYRTQLFLYLKACGRDELSTMNLWGGVDAPVAQTV